jgi:hypothetical protein
LLIESFLIDIFELPFDNKNPLVGKSEIKFTFLVISNESESLTPAHIYPQLYNSKITYNDFNVQYLTSQSNTSVVETVNYTNIYYDYYTLAIRDPINGNILLERDDIFIETSSRYTFLIFPHLNKSDDEINFIILNDIKSNGVHLAWQIPQTIVMALAELIVTISGQSFVYHYSPESMKSVLQSLWYSFIAIGDLIVIIVDQAEFTDNDAVEYLIFAGLMILATLLFFLFSFFFERSENKIKNHENLLSIDLLDYN